MRASAGDRLIIKGHLGQADRDGEVLDALGENRGPPYIVRWADTGRECLFFPGPDVVIHHVEHAVAR